MHPPDVVEAPGRIVQGTGCQISKADADNQWGSFKEFHCESG